MSAIVRIDPTAAAYYVTGCAGSLAAGIAFIVVALRIGRLRRIGALAAEILVVKPRELLVFTGGFFTTYMVALCTYSGQVVTPVEKTLEIIFAISSPRDAVGSLSSAGGSSLAVAWLPTLLIWAGWAVVASWTIILPALIAIVLEDKGSSVRAESPLRLSREGEEFVTNYASGIAALMKSVSAFEGSSRNDAKHRRTLMTTILRNVVEIARPFVNARFRSDVNASYSVLKAGADFVPRNAPVLYDTRLAGLVDRLLHVEVWAYDVPQSVRDHEPILLAVDARHPVPGGPRSIANNQVEILSDARDEECWRKAGMPEAHITAAVTFFRTVPFQSFISFPIGSAKRDRRYGVLTIQANAAGVFGNNEDTEQLRKQVAPFLVLLGEVVDA